MIDLEISRQDAKPRRSKRQGRAAPLRSWRLGVGYIFCLACFSLILSFTRPPSSRTNASLSSAQAPTPLHSRFNALPPAPGPAGKQATLASENFRVTYPVDVERREVEGVLRNLEKARADLLSRLASASLSVNEPAAIQVFIHNTTGDFAALTNQPPWAAGVTHDSRIELQPLEVLRRRGVLETTVRHEYAHALIEAIGGGRAPRWLSEGLAAHFAGEGQLLARQKPVADLNVDELERRLSRPTSPEEMRQLYAAAYHHVHALILARTEAHVWRLVRDEGGSARDEERE